MAIEVTKPDLYVVLKKRRRSVETMLKDHNVNSKESLDTLVRVLEVEYLISNRFLEEAKIYLDNIPPTLTEPSEEKTEEDDSKKRPKKTGKQSSKKSDLDEDGSENSDKKP